MTSMSLEAFDGNLRGKLSQWVLLSDICVLPNGFQDQILSSIPAFQTCILVTSKQDSKAWHLSYSWDMTFAPDSPNDWSLLLSVIQHLKKPILIVSTPKCNVPVAFWQKCMSLSQQTQITGAILKDMNDTATNTNAIQVTPNSIFFPRLDTITDTQFIKSVQQITQTLDLRSLYRDLRGAGASLCLSLIDSRLTINGSVPSYNATWFYPESNGALRLHISELRIIMRTVTERLEE